MTSAQHVDQLVLSPVRVLILVDQDVSEPLLVRSEDLGVISEETNRLHDQVVEIQGAGRPLPIFVGGEHASDGLLEEVGGHA